MNYLTKRFARLIEISKALKPLKQSGKSFHVSFALRGNKIIAAGTNSYNKSNPVCHNYKRTKYSGKNKTYNAGIHSEAYICGKLKHLDSWNNLTLVNIRIDNNLNLSNSCICVNCAAMLQRNDKKFKKIFFSTNHGDFLEFPQK